MLEIVWEDIGVIFLKCLKEKICYFRILCFVKKFFKIEGKIMIFLDIKLKGNKRSWNINIYKEVNNISNDNFLSKYVSFFFSI